MAEPHVHKCLVEFYGPTLTSLIEVSPPPPPPPCVSGVSTICVGCGVQVFPEKAQYPPEEEWQNTWSEGSNLYTVEPLYI